MYTIDFWNKFDLYRYKVILLTLFLVLSSCFVSYGQTNGSLNLPYFDNQNVHYGFQIGLHSSRFGLKYSDRFADEDDIELDTLHSIVPPGSMGFRIGFIADFHVYDIFDIRSGVTFSFNQLKLNYRYTDGTEEELLGPTYVYVEVPVLLKYKSIRRYNRRMYVLAGIKPGIRVSGSKDEEDKDNQLLINRFNLSLDIGAGFDLYQPLFKFSPEIRYSFGLMNVLDPEPNIYSAGIKSLNIHTLSVIITFEGGPSELKRKKK